MIFEGRVWRAHHPRWAWAPDSGEGARRHGGRFNPKGMAALYTSTGVITALAEAQQGFPVKAQPMTLVAYEVECRDLLDLTDAATLRRRRIDPAILACPWALLAAEGRPVPSHELARRLRREGIAGIIVPSHAPGARAGEPNIVFWSWSRSAPNRVTPIDDHGRLPAVPG